MAHEGERLSAFVDAWNAGEWPDVDEHLDRAPAEERGALAADIHTFLLHATPPEPSDADRAAFAADPVAQRIVAMPSESGLWPALLPSLRTRARLARDEVVARLAGALGIEGAGAKVGRYYHEMETGTLDPAGVSRRVLEALAQVLGVDRDELERAGAYRGFHPAGPEVAFLRARGGSYDAAEPPGRMDPGEEPEEGPWSTRRDPGTVDDEVLRSAAESAPASDGYLAHSAPAPEWDDVDELFRGGR